MSDKFSISNKKQKELIQLCNRRNISFLAIFGSVAKGKAKLDSDVDILVSFTKPIGLIALLKIESELRDMLGRPVDLITRNELNKHLETEVLNSMKVIYDEAA